MHQLTDNALMLKVKSGDLDKLGLLYERHKRRVFGFFFNMNGNASLSEDLVQNVFIRMLKYRHTFTGKGSFIAWMFKTARNVNYDNYKKYSKERNQNDLASIAHKLQDADDLSSTMDKSDNIAQLNKAMQKLPREKRDILVLSKYKEIKFSEIGEILGCTEGAAKVKAHRALKDLRTIFLQMEST